MRSPWQLWINLSTWKSCAGPSTPLTNSEPTARWFKLRRKVRTFSQPSWKTWNTATRTRTKVARYLNQIIFCLYAEDAGLLPDGLFAETLREHRNDPGTSDSVIPP